MATNRIDILINADDRATREIRRFENQTARSSQNVQKSFTDMALKAAAVALAIRAIGRTLSTFVDAASKVQQLQTRLTVLTGTLEKGNELFEEMADLAGRVPFTYDEIMESAVNLRAVVKGGNEEVVKLMPIILDLAATTGLGVQETTSQMIRMYSAGAGAADLFRERGVLAMLGFQAGVSVSAEETMDRVIAAWEDGASRFRGATDQLADTWAGRVSMMQDAWFKFRSSVGDFIIDSDRTKTGIDAITVALNFWAETLKVVDDEQSALMDDLLSNLARVDEALEKNLQRQSAPFLIGRNEVEREYNDLLEHRSRILLTINDIRAREQEQADVDNVVEEAEKIIQIEEDKVNFIEGLHNSLTQKIIDFRNKEFKNDEEKAKAKKKLNQEILNSQVSNLETFLAKQAQTNKAAAVAFKAVQFGRAVINTSEAVTEALPNLPLAALVAAIGAAEIASIAATGFAKGTDSVPSMLTPGEMVVPRDFAQAIREGRLSLGGPEGGGSFGDINIFIQGGINPGGASVSEMAEELGFAFEKELRTARGI